jgi:hypothetical protein
VFAQVRYALSEMSRALADNKVRACSWVFLTARNCMHASWNATALFGEGSAGHLHAPSMHAGLPCMCHQHTQEAAYDVFLSLDTDGDGKLDHKGVVDLAWRMAPDLRPREVRVCSWMRIHFALLLSMCVLRQGRHSAMWPSAMCR